MIETEKTDVLILGSGPAGFTAAIYAARAGFKPLVYQGDQPGGQLTITSEVENYPGYPKGIDGPQMMVEFQEQAERFGSDVRPGFATSVDFSKYPLEVTIDEEKIVEAKSVIIATGASAKWLGLPSETRLNGSGVSACAVCDGFFYKGLDVVVVGGGDTAAEEASYLSKICKKVYLLVRRDEMRASKIMQQRVDRIPNIEIMYNTSTDEILGENMVEAVRTINNITKETQELKVEGFFVAIGHKPNTGIFKDYLDLNESGYILTNPGSTKTKVPGVFVSGDAQDFTYRQAVTAAGTGCMAALDAERFLAEMEEHEA